MPKFKYPAMQIYIMALFGSKEKGGTITIGKKKEPEISPLQIEIRNKSFDIDRRLRLLEDRYSNLRKQLQFYEESALRDKQKITEEIKATDGQLSDLNHEIQQLRERLLELVKEISECARSEDLKAVEKYVDIWEPIKFLTVEEAKKMIDEYFGKK